MSGARPGAAFSNAVAAGVVIDNEEDFMVSARTRQNGTRLRRPTLNFL